MKSKIVPIACGLALSASLHAQITYIDASTSNVTRVDTIPFAPVAGGNLYADSNWSLRTGLASGGNILEGGGGEATLPVLKQTQTGLIAGTYEVYAYFWVSTGARWQIDAGLTAGSLVNFSGYGNQGANNLVIAPAASTQFAGPLTRFKTGFTPTTFAEGDRTMVQAHLGQAMVGASGVLEVFIDAGETTANGQTGPQATRTWFDGIGYINTDFDHDGMLDTWEITYGFNPEDPADANDDPDEDLVLNVDEYRNNGHPFEPDTDFDEANDKMELTAGTLLNNADSDGDYYIDGVEFARTTDPLDGGSFPSPAGGMKIDFSSTAASGQAGVFHHSDWFTYIAPHEVIGLTDHSETWSVPGFGGTAVDFTVAFPDSTLNTARQLIGRTDAQTLVYAGNSPRLLRDWVGIDTRTISGGNGTGTDTTMTFTFANLPAGIYQYRGYHHDVEFQAGRFGLKVTDATRTNADLGGFRMSHSGQNTFHLPENPAGSPVALSSTIEFVVVSNGTAPVVVTYTGRETASAFTSFVAVNGIELTGALDADGDFVPNASDLHPGQNDGILDDDLDGLSNLREFHLGTNPALADTDGDGIKDGVESDSGTFVGTTDSGTSPFRADTDGDGANDGAEASSGSNPFDPTNLPPDLPIKVLATSLNTTTNEYTITWESVPGATYDIVSSDDLTGAVATWPLAADDVASQGTTTTRVIAIAAPRPAKRYFVVIRN